MSRMLAALRHLEQRTGSTADPLPSPDPPEAKSRLVSDVNEMAVLDAPLSPLANVEFASSAGFVIAEAAPAGFVTNAFTVSLPAPKSGASREAASNVPISNSPVERAYASPVVKPIAVIEDPYDPSGSRQISGPYRADWSYGADRSTAHPRRGLGVNAGVPATAEPAGIGPPELLDAEADEAALPCLFESEEGEFSESISECFGSQRHIIAVPESSMATESAVVTTPVVEPESIIEHLVIGTLHSLPEPPAPASEPIAGAQPVSNATTPNVETTPATAPVAEKSSAAEPAMPTTSSVDLKIAQRASNRAAARPLTPDADRIPLPVSDPDTSSLYHKLCGRLLATHPKRDPNASTVAMFVAPVTVGRCEFSLVEIGRAAIESLTGRLLLVAADPHSEFLPAGLRGTAVRGVADVWRGLADWNDVVRGTSDRRIDVAAWGTGDLSMLTGPPSWDGARAAYELVLVAGSSEITPVVELLAPTCDAVVIVVSLGITGQSDAVNATRRLAAIGAPLAGCVVTGVPQ